MAFTMKVFATIALMLLPAAMATAGGKVEDFELPRAGGGEPFRLAGHRGRLVALHFLLKTECPFCMRHVQEYNRRAHEVPGVVQVFVKPDAEEEIVAWMKKSPVEIPLYRDADAALAKKLAVPDGYAFHGQTVHYPALILIDGEGNEFFRHIGRNNADRVPFDKFAAEVARLRPAARVEHYNLASDRVALKGYDPVSYFAGAPQAGKPDFQAAWNGVTYRFANADNAKSFAADPDKYVPAYGGWCATAMAEGKKVDIDPQNYKITGGRLFLFYKGLLGNAIKDWNKDEPALTARADAEWKKIANE